MTRATTNTNTRATEQNISVALAIGPSPRSAFTLIELLMAITIMVIGTAIVWPRYGRAVASYRADSAARRVAQDLKLASTFARQRSQSRLVTFNATGYYITGLRPLDGVGIQYVVNLSQEPYRCTLRGVDFAGTTQVSFDGYGVPVTAGVVRLQSGSTLRTVIMDAAGNTTITPN